MNYPDNSFHFYSKRIKNDLNTFSGLWDICCIVEFFHSSLFRKNSSKRYNPKTRLLSPIDTFRMVWGKEINAPSSTISSRLLDRWISVRFVYFRFFESFLLSSVLDPKVQCILFNRIFSIVEFLNPYVKIGIIRKVSSGLSDKSRCFIFLKSAKHFYLDLQALQVYYHSIADRKASIFPWMCCSRYSLLHCTKDPNTCKLN